MPKVRQHQLAAHTVAERARIAGLGIDHLCVDEAARAEVHAVLLLALAPERDADVADPHRLGDLRAPAVLDRGAERRFAAARLSRDQHAPDARATKIAAALSRA